MKIEVGQWYRNRRDQIAYVFGKRTVETNVEHPFYVETLAGAYSCTPAGKYYCSNSDGRDLVEHLPDCDSFTWVKPKPKPVYRPFASAAEFAPHRDKWIKRVDGPGCFRAGAYDNSCIFAGDNVTPYQFYFEHTTFDDGTPFGVLDNKE